MTYSITNGGGGCSSGSSLSSVVNVYGTSGGGSSNVAGATGATGITGATGASSTVPGATGAEGAVGATGATGPAGGGGSAPSGAAGNIVYLTASGVSESTANIFLSTSNLIGIGTTTPTANLHVIGNVYASNSITTINVFATRYYGDGGLLSNIAGSTFTQPLANLVVSNSVTTTNLFAAGFTSNAITTAFNFDTLTVPFFSATSIGIGTTTPAAPLSTYFGTTGTPDTTGSGVSNVAVRFQVGTACLDIGNTTTGNVWLQNHLSTSWATNYVISLNPNGGNIGIGTTSPGYQLDLSADGARKLTTSTWLTGSDERIKTDIQSANLQMCYDTVKSIDLKYFKWNFPTESNVVTEDEHSLGFIAQDIKAVFPNAVSESDSYGYTDFLSLNTDQILKTMYGALKQTMADKEALEARVTALEAR